MSTLVPAIAPISMTALRHGGRPSNGRRSIELFAFIEAFTGVKFDSGICMDCCQLNTAAAINSTIDIHKRNDITPPVVMILFI